MSKTTITTYPEMNSKIVGLLRISENPTNIYAAQRIMELETKLAAAEHRAEVAERALAEAGHHAMLHGDTGSGDYCPSDLYDDVAFDGCPGHCDTDIGQVNKCWIKHWHALAESELAEGGEPDANEN